MIGVPVMMLIGGMPVPTWTSMNLTRPKKDLTGELNAILYAGAMPTQPLVTAAKRGAPIEVYVAGHLAFTGTIDNRVGNKPKDDKPGFQNSGASARGTIGKGNSPKGGGASSHISAEEYNITIRARGMTKKLIGPSHLHKTGSILNTTTRKAAQEIVKDFGIDLEWIGGDIDIDKFRLRDGISPRHELQRIANEYGYYCYETRDGRLRFCETATGTVGDPLILGDNILEFEAEQSEEQQASEVQAKGQRSKKGLRGKDAVNRKVKIKTGDTKTQHPINLQFYGDATDELLRRRAEFEVANREQASTEVRLSVFGVQSKNGAPWDIGNLHYVEIPPEGIYDVMECTSVTHIVDAQKQFRTLLHLAPVAGVSGGGGLAGMAGLAGLSSIASIGTRRAAAAGFKRVAGQYPDPWSAMAYSVAADVIAPVIVPALSVPQKTPPLILPDHIARLFEQVIA